MFQYILNERYLKSVCSRQHFNAKFNRFTLKNDTGSLIHKTRSTFSPLDHYAAFPRSVGTIADTCFALSPKHETRCQIFGQKNLLPYIVISRFGFFTHLHQSHINKNTKYNNDSDVTSVYWVVTQVWRTVFVCILKNWWSYVQPFFTIKYIKRKGKKGREYLEKTLFKQKPKNMSGGDFGSQKNLNENISHCQQPTNLVLQPNKEESCDVSEISSNISTISTTDQRLFKALANPVKVNLEVAKPIPKGSQLPSKKQPRGEVRQEMKEQMGLANDVPISNPNISLSNTSANVNQFVQQPNFNQAAEQSQPIPVSGSGFQNFTDNNAGDFTAMAFDDYVEDDSDDNVDQNMNFFGNAMSGTDQNLIFGQQPGEDDVAYQSPFANNAMDNSLGYQQQTMSQPASFTQDVSQDTAKESALYRHLKDNIPSSNTPLEDAQPSFTFDGTDNIASYSSDLGNHLGEDTSIFGQAVNKTLQETENFYRFDEGSQDINAFSNHTPAQPTVQYPSHGFYDNTGVNSTARTEEEEDEERAKQSALLDLQRLKMKGVELTKEFTRKDDLSDMLYELDVHKMNEDSVGTIMAIKDGLKLIASLIHIGNEQIGPFLALDGFIEKWCETVDKQNSAVEGIYRKYWKRGSSSSPEMTLLFAFVGALVMTHANNKYGPMLFGGGNNGGGGGSDTGKGSDKKRREDSKLPPDQEPFSRVPQSPGAFGEPYWQPPQYNALEQNLNSQHAYPNYYYPQTNMPAYSGYQGHPQMMHNNGYVNQYNYPNGHVPSYYDSRYKTDPYGMQSYPNMQPNYYAPPMYQNNMAPQYSTPFTDTQEQQFYQQPHSPMGEPSHQPQSPRQPSVTSPEQSHAAAPQQQQTSQNAPSQQTKRRAIPPMDPDEE